MYIGRSNCTAPSFPCTTLHGSASREFSSASILLSKTGFVVQVVATLVASVLMDRAGRRKLLVVAGAGMALTCFTMGLYYYLSLVAPGSPGMCSQVQRSSLIEATGACAIS